MWTIIIIILVVLWLFGAFGNRLIPRIPQVRELGTCPDRNCGCTADTKTPYLYLAI